MLLLTIIWTLICAAIIIGYPVYLINKSDPLTGSHKKFHQRIEPDIVELLSFDIREQLPGWSLTLDVPQITEEILQGSPILFYLESDGSCIKLPMHNARMGYTANVYKNVGKVYVTFKSIKDGVSNFYVPNWHLKKIKILIIKSRDQKFYADWGIKPHRSTIHKSLTNAGVNINDYEEVLGYFSNIATIDFKGHFIAKMPKKKKRNSTLKPHPKERELFYTA
ncbi:MAG: hypothetical protein VX798_06760 [Bacteroidota bacterium]|uniref:Uncharacterized protein n=1 Tax=Flagellimonas profundi TaxID=2915620 RepID=A0ABS3FIT3_9FLAO|nr:hypothetical protein [Allomuricauda profundi]MBO0342431.1 hypothetical protein [Allomuricauda profundi]MEC7770865.1 hypothetical protein [Bacteroidota bacterium]